MKILKTTFIFCIALFISNAVLAQNKATEKADEYFNNLDFPRAINAYEKVVKKDSSNGYAIHQVGEAYRLIGENQKANPWYGLALELNPQSKEDLYYYARTLLTVGQYGKALETYKKYNSLYPGDSRASIYVETPDFYSNLNENSSLYEIVTVPFNSENSDYGPSLLFEELLFTSSRQREVAVKRKSTWKDEPFLDLYTVEINADRTYQDPNIIGDPITTKWHEGSASFDYLINRLYFTRTSYFEGELSTDDQGVTNIEIYSSPLNEDGSWGEIEPFPYNNSDYSVAQPAISPDGKKLYFVSDMPGGLGGVDIYVCLWNGQSWGEPKNLGAPVNTASHEKNPYVDPLGNLYFASTGHLGLGGLDIYYSEPKADNFDYPVNLGYPINTRFDDFCFTFYDEAELEFFIASNRDGGMGEDDIYKVIFHPEPIMLAANIIIKESLENTPITVLVTDQNGDLLASDTINGSRFINLSAYSKFAPWNIVFIPLLEDQAVGAIPDIDPETAQKGVINFGDIILGEDLPDEVVVENQIIIPDEFGVDPSADEGGGDLYYIKLPSGEKLEYRATPVYFAFDKYDLNQDYKNQLNQLIKMMKADKTLMLKIAGYTDSRGSREYNMKLGVRRATAALNYLVDNGIKSNRITIKSFGESGLVNQCSDGVTCTDQEHALNRRAEFELSK
jgi:outer membrane protein OmpA-like peptidoglycan-associated protein/tetratricopeptide (TPR) repeat protein